MGKWSHRMAEGLAQLGHAPTLWFAEDFPRLQRLGRLAVLAFPVALAGRLWRARRRFDAVVIHEPSGFWYGILRRLWPSLPPMVAMCHGVESQFYRAQVTAAARGLAVVSLGTRIKSPLFRLWQSNGTIQLADQVMCLSSSDRDFIIQVLGCPPGRVTRQVNGVAAADLVPRPEAAPGQRVLFVGGWLDTKGRRLLPSLWSQVRRRFPQARLTAVGTGWPAEAVRAEFAPADRESVTVIPLLREEAAMRAQFAAHDLFLMPSIFEGSPLALLEALAAGLPVVATRVGGIPDMITHEQHGLLFDALDPADGAAQVSRLLVDPVEAARLGRAGQERARELTWAASTQTLVQAIERALARAHGSKRPAEVRGTPAGASAAAPAAHGGE